MNDNRRAELEQFFDGELPVEQRARVECELADDPAAVRYIEQLQQLRNLARAHDPSAESSPSRMRMPWNRRPVLAWRWAVTAAGVAAAVILLTFGFWSSRPHEQVAVRRPTGLPVPDRNETVGSRVPPPAGSAVADAALQLDAQRYAWANGELTSPALAARTVLDHGPRRNQRATAELEILALELANASDASPRELGRTVVERTTLIRHQPVRLRGMRRPANSNPENSGGASIESSTNWNLLIAIGSSHASPTGKKMVS